MRKLAVAWDDAVGYIGMVGVGVFWCGLPSFAEATEDRLGSARPFDELRTGGVAGGRWFFGGVRYLSRTESTG